MTIPAIAAENQCTFVLPHIHLYLRSETKECCKGKMWSFDKQGLGKRFYQRIWQLSVEIQAIVPLLVNGPFLGSSFVLHSQDKNSY